MQLVDLLNKSEFLECNETESIADYLLKQRVISDNQYHDIINAKPRKTKNKLLLETLNNNSLDEENENINIYGLFVNALRYAGCHYMANILDVDEPLYGNNDSNNTRKKGQISIFIQVSAVQIKAKHLISRQTSKSDNNNSNFHQEINNSIWLDKKSFIPASIDNIGVNCRKKVGKKRNFLSILFCCLCCGGGKKSKKNLYNSVSQNLELNFDNQQDSIDPGRQVKIDILTEKSVQLYTHLNTNTSAERDSLIKYFEQSHQILVFETKFDEAAMVITVICTKQDTLSKLQVLLQSGQLEKDFNDILRSKAIFDLIDVKDIKLSINILPEELICAMKELDLSKKKRI